MEFDINVNLILKDVITKVDSRLQVCKTGQARFPDAKCQLFEIIDKMGEASARAQSLSGVITTGRKLEMSDHYLYIMKDSEGSRNKGAVVGILKTGRKRLFVYDRHGQQWEINPVCVLDFYIHESRQRMGCGRKLFDFMLKNENINPQHMAVDRPSHKFSSFLAKHYGLTNQIPQVNNFVIFEGFFTKRPQSDFLNKRDGNMPIPADYPDRDVPRQNVYNKKVRYQRGNTTAGLPSLLSKHQTAQNDKILRELNINPRSALVMRSGSSEGLTDLGLTTVSAGSGTRLDSTLPLHSAMYSRHQPVDLDPSINLAQRPPSGNKAGGHRTLSKPGNRAVNRPPSGNRNPSRPSSRKDGEEEELPLLPRDGPPRDYLNSFNLHQNYQGKAGHLIVPPDPRVGMLPPSSVSTSSIPNSSSPSIETVTKAPTGSIRSPYGYSGYYTRPSLYANGDTSWTVLGVLRNQQYVANRHSGHSKLW